MHRFNLHSPTVTSHLAPKMASQTFDLKLKGFFFQSSYRQDPKGIHNKRCANLTKPTWGPSWGESTPSPHSPVNWTSFRNAHLTGTTGGCGNLQEVLASQRSWPRHTQFLYNQIEMKLTINVWGRYTRVCALGSRGGYVGGPGSIWYMYKQRIE